MRENLSTRKCHIGLDARKFSSAKISTFTVLNLNLQLFLCKSSHGSERGEGNNRLLAIP